MGDFWFKGTGEEESAKKRGKCISEKEGWDQGERQKTIYQAKWKLTTETTQDLEAVKAGGKGRVVLEKKQSEEAEQGGEWTKTGHLEGQSTNKGRKEQGKTEAASKEKGSAGPEEGEKGKGGKKKEVVTIKSCRERPAA